MINNQKGFTLIEVIAVLIILGILAAVAIPRFTSVQNDARRAAAQGGVAAAQSAISLGYASYLLGNTTYSGPDAACASVILSSPGGVEFNITCTGSAWNQNSEITVTYGGQVATGNWIIPLL